MCRTQHQAHHARLSQINSVNRNVPGSGRQVGAEGWRSFVGSPQADLREVENRMVLTSGWEGPGVGKIKKADQGYKFSHGVAGGLEFCCIVGVHS